MINIESEILQNKIRYVFCNLRIRGFNPEIVVRVTKKDMDPIIFDNIDNIFEFLHNNINNNPDCEIEY